MNGAPPAPLLIDLRTEYDSGVDQQDNLTNIPSAIVDVTASRAGDTLRLYREGTFLGEATAVDGTHYEYAFSAEQLAVGTNAITARSYDGTRVPVSVILASLGAERSRGMTSSLAGGSHAERTELLGGRR